MQYGVAFAAWLREQRLNAAKRTLVLSALAVSEVARDSGFGDVHTFIRCFRAKFGRTPGAFRRDGAAGRRRLARTAFSRTCT